MFDADAPRARARPGRPTATLLLGAAVLGACAWLLLARLGAGSLQGDEARYAAVVDETRAAGGPLPWRLGGEPYVDKPPVGLLVLAASFRALGESELAARLPAALCGLGTAALLFAFAARRSHPLAGAVAALTWVATPTALSRHGLRGGTFDALLALLTVGAMTAWIGSLGPGAGPRRWRLAGVLVALATAVKSLVAPVLVGATVLAGELAAAAAGVPGARPARALRRAGALVLAGAAVLLAWVATLAAAGVPDAAARLVGWDLVARATRGVDPTHLGPPAAYLGQARDDFGLALLLALPALAALALRARRRDTAALAFLLPVVLWPLVMTALLSAAASKLAWYALPAWAGVALLLGTGAGTLLRAARGGAAAAAAGLCVAALLAPGLVRAVEIVRKPVPRAAFDRLGRALAGVPEARLWAAPGVDLSLRSRHDPAHRAPLSDANGYYAARLGTPRRGWGEPAAPGECALVLVPRRGEVPVAGAPGDWPRHPLSDTPLAVLDGCGGRVVDRLRRPGGPRR